MEVLEWDLAGPLFVKDTPSSTSRKVWICLYTCCTTRAVHLDLVPVISTQAFIRSFKRFAARRGFPIRIVSDNAKTFKAASKTIRDALESPEMKQFYNSIQLKWNFNLERAPSRATEPQRPGWPWPPHFFGCGTLYYDSSSKLLQPW